MPSDSVLPLSGKRLFGGRGRPHARGRLRTPRGGAFAALLAHICLIVAILRLDPLSLPASGSRVFAVSVVTARAPPRRLPEALERVQEQRTPVSHQGEERRKGYFALENTPGNALARDKPAQVPSGMAREGKRQDSKGTRDPQQARRRGSPGAGTTSYHFRAFAVPLPAAHDRDAANYQVVVGSLLERAKKFPESARKRGAKGIAKIGFAIDESGGVAGVSLLRSSGQDDLDAEGIALVRRASPFPPPPAGAKRAFAIEVAFGSRT